MSSSRGSRKERNTDAYVLLERLLVLLLLFLLQKYKRRLPLRLLRLSMDNLLLPFLQMHR